jgi:RNA polymerase sigma factor (TIGR02999 family)
MSAWPLPESELESIYSELRKLAAFHLRRGVPRPSLQPTMLVNETWLRLSRQPWKSKTYFLALASHVMRKVLIDYVRARLAQKRDGAWSRVTLESSAEPHTAAFAIDLPQILAVDQALERLAELDRRKAQVVEMRFFGGMEFSEIAEALNVSLITVKRDWQFSRAWLYETLSA